MCVCVCVSYLQNGGRRQTQEMLEMQAHYLLNAVTIYHTIIYSSYGCKGEEQSHDKII